MAHEQVGEVVPAPWRLRGEASAILFRRGLLAFIRYTESSVGPYDELLWLTLFRRGPAGRAHFVSRIYVSSEASARGGRANWGLPKELARFHISPLRAGSERIDVLCEGRLLAAFTRTRPHGLLPLPLTKLPRRARRLVQLSEGRCFETVPEGHGRFALTRVSHLEVDRELFPDARSSRWRPALYLSGFELSFPAARVFDPPALKPS